METGSHSNNDTQRELAYYKKKLDELSGESIRHDYALSTLRYELKQKKDAFAILTNLQKEFSVRTPISVIFETTVKAIINHLGMDRSMILTSLDEQYAFEATHWHGFPEEQLMSLKKAKLTVPDQFLHPGYFILCNKSTAPAEINSVVQSLFGMNFFIGVPVFHDNKPFAFLVSGRQIEKAPFYQPLNIGDGDTLMAIASLITTVLQNKNINQLRAEMIKQKEENTLINKMLLELKAAQAQLIQQEKMASLGELTAGIAHEIQNPLNFVNNFSEVNKELIGEMKAEIDKGNYHSVKLIAGDIEINEDKINSHGKRADAIVKGMLQHSHAGSGQKELTDINALADEYLRLAYHGWRAKNKSFNVTVKTDFDQGIHTLNIVPQDIGRAILNLVNNAFYAVNEKHRSPGLPAAPSLKLQRSEAGQVGAVEQRYEPSVAVSSSATNGSVEIKVKDNGNGIPEKLLDKIFQPFFTTKPTGQGTGLGLSLAYDIIKSHGGEIRVNTKESEGTEFVIVLPL